MEVLIVGAGLIGRKRAKNLSQGFSLKGVYDLNSEVREKFALDFKCKSYRSLDEAIGDMSQRSLVVVAVRHSDLSSIGKNALLNGMHILLEKPGATHSNEMAELNGIAKQKNLSIAVGYNHRFHPAALELKKILDSGIYGPVQLIRARYGHGGRPGYENEWRANKSQSGGGELMDQGCHLLDLMRYFGFMPEVRYSLLPTLYWKMNVEDNALLAGRLDSKALFWIHASWTEWKNQFSLEVFCKTAKLEWRGLGGSYGRELLIIHHMPEGLGIPTEETKVFDVEDKSWSLEIESIESFIEKKPSTCANGDDAEITLKVIEESYEIAER